ncbi:MAG: hypothetical protein V4539_12900 [Bacteroidota bacterium]
MRTYFVSLLLFVWTAVMSQTQNSDQLKKMVRDVLQDSSLSADLAKINGLPSRISYAFQNNEKGEIILETQFIQKEYYRNDKEPLLATILDYKYKIKKYQKFASFTLLLPDGSKASVRAELFSANLPWHPIFYHLRGRNLETGGKVRIIRAEI